MRVRDIKQEMVETNVRPAPRYSSSEPECITIYDSDEEEYHHNTLLTPLENHQGSADTIMEEGEDQEVQIVMESETSLYEKVLRNLKVEYIEPPDHEEKVTEDDQYNEMTEEARERMENKTGEALLESDREDDQMSTKSNFS